MAFSLEAMVTVPLTLVILLQPVRFGPETGLESIRQTKETLQITKGQINPPTFYTLVAGTDGLSSVQASPQLMIEIIDLVQDAWQPLSRLVGQ
ncbi:MAG TPA: hypothetical protein GXZ64_08835 [Clostridiaceae bacterium]|nr:hypothetical protein [Clostridiaceae bacterium]